MEDNLKYYGPIPAYKASAYFKSADALYVSLKDEGYVGKTIPNKLVMSMAFKKPILAMLSGDGKNILKAADGAVYSEQNASSLVDAIKAISSMSKEELSRLGTNNYNYYKNNLTVETVSKKIEQELINKCR